MKFIELDIQLFGGRGSLSYKSTNTLNGKEGKPSPFYDKTNIYKGLTKQEFENKIRKYKNEFIGVYDENGKITIAGTSYKRGTTAVPNEIQNAYGFTHNHPSGEKEGRRVRTIGGTFSGSDLKGVSIYNTKEGRATANEATYVIRAKNNKTTAQGRKKLVSLANKTDKYFEKKSRTNYTRVANKFKKQGKRMSDNTYMNVIYGTQKSMIRKSIEKAGYDYIEIPKNKR